MSQPAGRPAPPDPFHPPHDADWQAKWTEPALEPDLPIIDAHHHLFDRPYWRYTEQDLMRDVTGGHRIFATVFLQCGERYRTDGPEHLRPVGETEFVDSVAVAAESVGPNAPRLCAAIVGHADLTMGAAVDEVLLAHLAASPKRFRGIRHGGAGDTDPAFTRQGARPCAGLYARKDFREGFARLGANGMSFDAWLYHPQLGDLVDLARAFPATPIVLDHIGGPLGLGHYASIRDQVFAQWRTHMAALASCPNVVVKLGGLGMRLFGFGFESRDMPPTSQELADAWRPYLLECIDLFGPDRCLFESNFPVDGCSCAYPVLWNAFKRVAAGFSRGEREALFAGTAARVYRVAGA